MALFGRVISGVGIETQNVAIYAFISLWFCKSNHGLALGVSVVCIRFGSVFAGYVVPIIQTKYNFLYVDFAFITGIGLCGTGVVLILNYIDNYNHR